MSSPSAAVPYAQPVRGTNLSANTSSFRVLSRPSPSIDTRMIGQPPDLGRENSLNDRTARSSGSHGTRLHAGDMVTSPTSDHTHQASYASFTSPADSQRSSGVPGLSDSRGTTIDSVSHTPVSAYNHDVRTIGSMSMRKGSSSEVEEEPSEEEGDDSTGSRTPRRRGSGPFGFGFSLTRRPSDKLGEHYLAGLRIMPVHQR